MSTYVHLLETSQIKRATIWIFLIIGKTHAWIQKKFSRGIQWIIVFARWAISQWEFNKFEV